MISLLSHWYEEQEKWAVAPRGRIKQATGTDCDFNGLSREQTQQTTPKEGWELLMLSAANTPARSYRHRGSSSTDIIPIAGQRRAGVQFGLEVGGVDG